MATSHASTSRVGAAGAHAVRRRIIGRRANHRQGVFVAVAVVVLALAPAFGCAPSRDPQPQSVEQVWRESATKSNADTPPPSAAATADDDARAPTPRHDDAIARVNGTPIWRRDIVDMLMDARGLDLLEQMVVLEAARQAADEAGIRVTQSEIQAEYDRSLNALLVDQAVDEPPALRQQAAEAMLSDMLTRRNISRREYMIVMERNAILRKLVSPHVQAPTESELRAEYDRVHGERVEIRHIQVGSRADADKIVRKRAAGADFAQLAAQYSANRGSAERGGLLPPFSRDDPDVPAPLRQAAFTLDVGRESAPIYIDGWFHIIRVERRIDADPVDFDSVRDTLKERVMDRRLNAAMQTRYAEMFNAAQIDIRDPELRERFIRRYPDRGTVTRDGAPPGRGGSR